MRGQGDSLPHPSENRVWSGAECLLPLESHLATPVSLEVSHFFGGQSLPWQVTLCAPGRQHLVMGTDLPKGFSIEEGEARRKPRALRRQHN